MNETKSIIDVDKPLWHQGTYFGRWRHMAFITDCRTLIVPEEKLQTAKKLCNDYKVGIEPKGTDIADIIHAKKLKDSAFHPDNGALMHVMGRMSFLLPGSVALTTSMLRFYKNVCATVGCQVINQAFHTFVNYTNRDLKSSDSPDVNAFKQAFLCASAASCATALIFRRILCRRSSIATRWVPFYAVAVGNMVNLPMIRQKEIADGIPLFVQEDTCIMRSKVAAVKGTTECVLTRIIMAAPGMITIPLITERIKRYCFYQLHPWIGLPIEMFLCTTCLLIMIPSAYAIFPERNALNPKTLKLYPSEYEEFDEIMGDKEWPSKVYYDKGL